MNERQTCFSLFDGFDSLVSFVRRGNLSRPRSLEAICNWQMLWIASWKSWIQAVHLLVDKIHKQIKYFFYLPRKSWLKCWHEKQLKISFYGTHLKVGRTNTTPKWTMLGLRKISPFFLLRGHIWDWRKNSWVQYREFQEILIQLERLLFDRSFVGWELAEWPLCKAERRKRNFCNDLFGGIFFSPRGSWICKTRKK